MKTTIINYLEGLAKIRLAGEEKAALSPQLEEMVEYFNTLSELDTAGVEPMSHCVEIRNALRKDEAKPSMSAEEALKNANDTVGGYFAAEKAVEI